MPLCPYALVPLRPLRPYALYALTGSRFSLEPATSPRNRVYMRVDLYYIYIYYIEYIYIYIYISAGPFRGHQAARDIWPIADSKSFQSFKSQVDNQVFQSFPVLQSELAVCQSGISFWLFASQQLVIGNLFTRPHQVYLLIIIAFTRRP